MKRSIRMMSALTVLMVMGASAMPAPAASRCDNYRSDRYYSGSSRYYGPEKQYGQKALMGGGIGAALGGLMATRGDTANGAVKGALLGAGLGLGYEYLKQKQWF